MNHLFDSFRAGMGDPAARLIETGDGRVLTYGDALAGSARLAHVLGQLGVRPGDRVAVQVEKSPEGLLLYLACIRAGAAFLPLNPDYTLSELRYFFRDAEPSLVVCAPDKRTAVTGIVNPGVKVETLGDRGDGSILAKAATAAAEFRDAEAGPGDLAAILYTSGTTGRSKGAMLTHDNLASNARTLVSCWRFAKDDVLIHALPIFHTHGLFVATNVTLVAGASMLFFDRFNPAAVIQAMRRATVLMGVPTFYVRLLQQPELTRDAIARMRLFVSGSAPLLPETFNAWLDRTGHAILERYGMTETNMNTSNPYDGERIAGTVGPALPGVDIRIVEPQSGAPLVRGEIGMIEVRGPNVFKGYWRMPEKTATEFRDNGFFSTGDLGLIDQRGYVHIVGRGKDLVISGGFNVYPKEIESEIDQIPGVVESAVIGLPHADFGEGVTAIVVKDVDSPLQEDAIVSALADKLARYKQPKRVLFIDELPRNAMGKVQKNVLRQQFARLYEGEAKVRTRP